MVDPSMLSTRYNFVIHYEENIVMCQMFAKAEHWMKELSLTNKVMKKHSYLSIKILNEEVISFSLVWLPFF